MNKPASHGDGGYKARVVMPRDRCQVYAFKRAPEDCNVSELMSQKNHDIERIKGILF